MKILQNIMTKNTFIPIYLNVDGEHLNLFCSDFEYSALAAILRRVYMKSRAHLP
jgi:hypothetical protein